MNKWRFRKPTKTGYYWVWLKNAEEPQIVSVLVEDGVTIYFAGNDTPFVISGDDDPIWDEDKGLRRGALWNGPLPVPEFDKGWLMWLKDKVQRKHGIDLE